MSEQNGSDPVAAADSRVALDPATRPEVLAQIAQARPELRVFVAMNPSTYPGLVEWLATLGDPAVDAGGCVGAEAVHADQDPGRLTLELVAAIPAGKRIVRQRLDDAAAHRTVVRASAELALTYIGHAAEQRPQRETDMTVSPWSGWWRSL